MMKKLSTALVLSAFVLAITKVTAGPLAYGICQAGCNAIAVACYAASGAVFGPITAGLGTVPAIVGCNSALGVCMASCVAAGLVMMKKLSTALLLSAFVLAITKVTAGPLAYGICQTGCNAIAVACYAAAGAVFGTISAGVGTAPAIVGCNSALGVCMASCVAAGLVMIKKLSTVLVLTAFVLAITKVNAGPVAYGICQAGCNAIAAACYAAAGAKFGTVTAGVGTAPAIVGCNSALGACMVKCVAAGFLPIP
ncbi:hypothetical protein CCR75_000535 [Bremia lactucae]|uniref:Uncharacterized protein n=1 Tax=Bremia lactucae TaxID=4779 RepID=A0A976IJ72_BRELC|nr:hypothetical protein CCR75_000535 [Bremia lactucae]